MDSGRMRLVVFNQIQETRTGNLEDTAVSQGTSPPRWSQQRRVVTGCRGRGGRVTENCRFLSPGPPPGPPLYAARQGRSDPIPSRLTHPLMVLSQSPSRCGLRQASGVMRRSPLPWDCGIQSACRMYPSSSQVGSLLSDSKGEMAGAWIRLGIPPPVQLFVTCSQKGKQQGVGLLVPSLHSA